MSFTVCSIAEEKNAERAALPTNLESAIKGLKHAKEGERGNTPEAKQMSSILAMSMQMGQMTAGEYKELSKVLAENKGGRTWCQITDHGLAVLFEFEGFDKVQGGGREFFIGFLWGLLQGASGQSDPMPKELAIGFIGKSGVTCIMRGKPLDEAPKTKDLKVDDLFPFFE